MLNHRFDPEKFSEHRAADQRYPKPKLVQLIDALAGVATAKIPMSEKEKQDLEKLVPVKPVKPVKPKKDNGK